MAQIGSLKTFKTGGYQDETSFQISLNQNLTPIRKVTFLWKNYNNGYYDRAHWIFEFFDESGASLGKVDNRPGEEDATLIEEGYKLKKEKFLEKMDLGSQEIIAGLKMGLDDEQNVVYVQFVVVRTPEGC